MAKEKLTEKEMLELRDYMRYQVSQKNKMLSGILSKVFDVSGSKDGALNYANVYNKITNCFSSCGEDYLSNELKAINEHRDSTKKKHSPYNYFDLNTLVAYNNYLGFIVDNMASLREFAERQYYTKDDLWATMHDLKTWSKRKDTNYNRIRPIVTLKDESGKLAPEKTPKENTIFKIHSEKELRSLLREYLGRDAEPDRKYTEPETIIYKGIKFNITYLDKMCFDKNGSPIKYIRAENDLKNKKILGYFTQDDRVYRGDVYDKNGEILVDKDQTGVDEIGTAYKKTSSKPREHDREM